MSNAYHFAKLDILSFKPYRKYLLLLPIVLFSLFDMDTTVMIVVFLMFLLLTSISPYLFASEDKSSMNQLYALLPVDARDIVLGRYMCCMFFGLVYIAVIFLILAFLPLVGAFGLTLSSVGNGLLPCVSFFLISIACQFPIFFKLGFIKGKFAMLAPAFFLFALHMAYRAITGVDALRDISVFSTGMSVGLLVIGIAMILLSLWISIKIYESRKE